MYPFSQSNIVAIVQDLLSSRSYHPKGTFDTRQRFYLALSQYSTCRSPSAAHPFSEMRHGRTGKFLTAVVEGENIKTVAGLLKHQIPDDVREVKKPLQALHFITIECKEDITTMKAPAGDTLGHVFFQLFQKHIFKKLKKKDFEEHCSRYVFLSEQEREYEPDLALVKSFFDACKKNEESYIQQVKDKKDKKAILFHGYVRIQEGRKLVFHPVFIKAELVYDPNNPKKASVEPKNAKNYVYKIALEY